MGQAGVVHVQNTKEAINRKALWLWMKLLLEINILSSGTFRG